MKYKYYLSVLFILFIIKTLNAQTSQNNSNISNQSPQYPGGTLEMFKFIDKTLKYPEEARKKNIQGTVTVKMAIDVDGSVKLPKVTVSVHPLLDAEAIRIVKAMPKWIPGKQKGVNVATFTSVQIQFRSDFDTDAIPVKDEQNVNIVEHKEQALSNEPYTFVEQMPRYKGNEYIQAIKIFAEKNLKYPEKAIQDKNEGRVYLQFTVDKSGKIKDIAIIRGINPLLDEEAIRIIKLMKKWEPGKNNGKAVDVQLTGLINFQLKDLPK